MVGYLDAQFMQFKLIRETHWRYKYVLCIATAISHLKFVVQTNQVKMNMGRMHCSN